MEFLWDLHQQKAIADAQVEASAAKRAARPGSDRLAELETEVQRLTLVSQALWELLRDRTGLSETELVAKINEIDLRDGKLDGRISAKLIHCPRCGRTMSERHSRCIYCGTRVSPSPASGGVSGRLSLP